MAPDILRAALGDDPALVQDHDALAQAHDQGHVVLDDQEGDAQVTQSHHQVHQVFRFPGVEAGGGFVQEQEPGRLGQGPGDFQAALLPVGQGFRRPVGFIPQVDEIQPFPGPLPVLHFG